MSEPEQRPGPVRRIGDAWLALARNRLELFGIELQEEKLRLLTALVWFAVAVAFGVAGLLLGMGALAIWLWTIAGYWGLIGLGAAALAVSALIIWAVRQHLRVGPRPFAGTVAEFRKDGECLRKN
jgi:uncharacterized membrane protein YqjE